MYDCCWWVLWLVVATMFLYNCWLYLIPMLCGIYYCRIIVLCGGGGTGIQWQPTNYRRKQLKIGKVNFLKADDNNVIIVDRVVPRGGWMLVLVLVMWCHVMMVKQTIWKYNTHATFGCLCKLLVTGRACLNFVVPVVLGIVWMYTLARYAVSNLSHRDIHTYSFWIISGSN